VAFCKYGETPNIYVISLEGEILQKRDEYFFSDLIWSPDGSAIAVSLGGPDLVDHDTKYSVLAVWWLEKDEIQLMSDAKREVHYYPIWLTDGSHILFTRLLSSESEGEKSGLYLVDIQMMQMEPLQKGPPTIVSRIIRSPRSDTLVFWRKKEIFVLEIGKEPISIGKGSQPVWHPDGKTIFYIEESGQYRIFSLDFPAGDQVIGGYFSSSTIHLQPGIYFK
jgi:Tol biopolymer transport system component